MRSIAPPAALLLALAGSAVLALRPGVVHALEGSAAAGPAAGTLPGGQLEEISIEGERPGPRLWKVTRGEHVLWIMGTLNHLPRRMVWRSAEVDGVIAQSQEVLPAGPSVSTGVGPIAMVRLYFQWRSTQKNPSRAKLQELLPAGLYARFEALKSRFDAHDQGIEELRPSFAALRLYEKAIDAAGLTGRDDVERAVLKLAARHHVPVRRTAIAVPNPSGALQEVSSMSPALEINCLETTVTRLETDLPVMQQRGRAWAVGDVDRLRQLSFPDQREACVGALSNAPSIRELIERATAGWDAAAAAALADNQVSFAMRPIYDLLDPNGPLSRLRAAGATVEGP